MNLFCCLNALEGVNRDLKIYNVNFNDATFETNKSSRKTKRMNNFYSPKRSQHRRRCTYNVT